MGIPDQAAPGAPSSQGTQARVPGLEALRILSMLLVVVLHLLGRGGVLANVTPFNARYWAAWLLETAAYCAVDCYALLSGYLLVRSRCRPERLLELWLQVFCYSAGLTALFALFREPVSLSRFFQSCLPVTFTQYWYVTAYFAVYCFAPFMNRLIASLSRDGFRRLLGTLFVLLSLLPGIFRQDPFVTGEGYSFLWLAALYFAGAYWRLYPPKPRRSRFWLGIYALCIAALLLSRLALDAFSLTRGDAAVSGGWLLTYSSPLVVGAALGLFQCCRTLPVGHLGGKLIGFFAPVSFGVYLFHAQPFVFHRILDGAAAPLLTLPAWQFALAIPAMALGIFLLGALVDWARLLVFRLLGIPRLSRALGAALERRLPPL